MTNMLENQPNLTIKEAAVKRLILSGDRCLGVVLDDGAEIFCKATVLTTGTF